MMGPKNLHHRPDQIVEHYIYSGFDHSRFSVLQKFPCFYFEAVVIIVLFWVTILTRIRSDTVL